MSFQFDPRRGLVIVGAELFGPSGSAILAKAKGSRLHSSLGVKSEDPFAFAFLHHVIALGIDRGKIF